MSSPAQNQSEQGSSVCVAGRDKNENRREKEKASQPQPIRHVLVQGIQALQPLHLFFPFRFYMGPAVNNIRDGAPLDAIPLPLEAQLLSLRNTRQHLRHEIRLVRQVVILGGDEEHPLGQLVPVRGVDGAEQGICGVLAGRDICPVEDGRDALQHVRLAVLGILVRPLVFAREIHHRVEWHQRLHFLLDPWEL